MEKFFAAIDRYGSAPPERRVELDNAVWEEFGVERAVLVLDMSGFSLATRRRGIVPYLAMVRRMQEVTGPVVGALGGDVVKYEADNLFAVFPDVPEAVEAAGAINRAIAAGNALRDGEDAVQVSIGISFGRLLLVPGKDLYGDCVNLACKLGEDVAGPGEALLTTEAHERLGGARPCEPLEIAVSGLTFTAYRLLPA